MFLREHGVPIPLAQRVADQWGPSTRLAVERDPYAALSGLGLPFRRAMRPACCLPLTARLRSGGGSRQAKRCWPGSGAAGAAAAAAAAAARPSRCRPQSLEACGQGFESQAEQSGPKALPPTHAIRFLPPAPRPLQ